MSAIRGEQIADAPDGIDTAQLNDGAVETAKILNLNVTEGKIAASAVTTGKINNTAVTEDKLATSVAGGGLTGGGGSVLAVGAGAAINVDVDDIDVKVKAAGAVEIDTDELDVKDLGIDEARLAALSVATGKIQNDAVDETKLDLAKIYDFSAAGGVKVGTPAVDTDAANKAYVDAVAQGLKAKDSVVAKTTAWSEMSGYTFTGGEWTGVAVAPTFDTITLADQERVLVTHGEVTTPEAAPGNGLFYYDATSQKLIRTDDADTWDELVSAFVFVEEGSANADSGWVCTIDAGGTLNTTDVTWTQFSGAGAYSGGDGIDITGTVISADLKASGGLKIDTAEIAVEPTDFAGDGLEDDGSDNLRLDLKSGGGLKIDTAEVTVEPGDFAGTGLEDDGSDNLRIAAPGNGLTGGAGSALAVDPDTTADSPSIGVGANGVKAAVPYNGNKFQAPNTTSGDDEDTGLTIAQTPAGNSYVSVLLNGVEYEVGDGVKTKDCYFTNDAGSTARAVAAIASGDALYWNGTIAYVNLKTAKDKISMNYNFLV